RLDGCSKWRRAGGEIWKKFPSGFKERRGDYLWGSLFVKRISASSLNRAGTILRIGEAMKTLAAILSSVLAGLLVHVIGFGQTPGDSKPLIVIFIVDGLRPDSINILDTPTIARLRKEGVEYVNSHSIFPTVTRVNATALATVTYAVLNGIVGNTMFVSGVYPRTAF